MEVPTFGRTLRAWRDSTTTGPALPRRRVPGLRRQELAQMAQVSTDYLQRLEQDRANPSPEVVNALARALGLPDAATVELLRLAGHTSTTDPRVPRNLSPGARRLLDRLPEKPIGVYDASWTWITGNESWAALFHHVPAPPGREGNVVWLYFTGGAGFIEQADRDQHERYLVTSLRRAAQRYPEDPDIADMVVSLRRLSSRFAALWQEPENHEDGGHRGTILGTAVGDVTLDWEVLTVHDTEQHIVVFSADPGSSDADGLGELRSAEAARRMRGGVDVSAGVPVRGLR